MSTPQDWIIYLLEVPNRKIVSAIAVDRSALSQQLFYPASGDVEVAVELADVPIRLVLRIILGWVVACFSSSGTK